MRSLDELRGACISDETEVCDISIDKALKAMEEGRKKRNSQSCTVTVAMKDGVVLKIDGVKHWYYESKSEMFFIHYEGNKNFIIAKKEIKYIGDDENMRRFETE